MKFEIIDKDAFVENWHRKLEMEELVFYTKKVIFDRMVENHIQIDLNIIKTHLKRQSEGSYFNIKSSIRNILFNNLYCCNIKFISKYFIPVFEIRISKIRHVLNQLHSLKNKPLINQVEHYLNGVETKVDEGNICFSVKYIPIIESHIIGGEKYIIEFESKINLSKSSHSNLANLPNNEFTNLLLDNDWSKKKILRFYNHLKNIKDESEENIFNDDYIFIGGKHEKIFFYGLYNYLKERNIQHNCPSKGKLPLNVRIVSDILKTSFIAGDDTLSSSFFGRGGTKLQRSTRYISFIKAFDK